MTDVLIKGQSGHAQGGCSAQIKAGTGMML